MPAYNAAPKIDAALRSVLAQTVGDLEVIVVDDGSADHTAAVAEAIEDGRVQVIRQENAGAAAARNTGLSAASGTYVALLDADDLWVSHKLERQLQALESDASASAVRTGVIFVDDELNPLSVRRPEPSDDALLETLLFKNLHAMMSTLLFERARLEVMGRFNPSLEILEEWDFAIKIARHCNLVSIPEPLALYRQHPGNRSANLDIHIAPGFAVLEEVFADEALPERVRKRERLVWATFFTMLTGAAFRVRRWRDCAFWAWRAMKTHPAALIYMAGLPARRVARWRSRATIDDSTRAAIASVRAQTAAAG
jgi:glycosyltransferase involved in cell wall biosynthesis